MKGARTLAWIAATGCCALGAPAAATAAVVDDAPAAAAHQPGQVEVFIRGVGGTPLYSARTASGAWTPWRALDGSISSGPGAVARAGQTDLFARGLDFQMYYRAQNSAGFSPWQSLGGSSQSAAAAFRERGSGTLVTFVRWNDNEVFEDYYSAGAWSGWNPVPGGGLTLSAPAATSRLDNYVNLFVRGTDDHIYADEWNGSAWSGWVLLDGTTTTASAPAVVSRSPGTMDLFIRRGDGQIYQRHFNGTSWSGYAVLRGVVASGPGATVDAAGNIYLFARLGGDVAANIYDGRGWSGWHRLHPPPPPPPPGPRCSFSAGHMSAKTHSVAFGRRPHVSGRVVSAAGRPLAGAGLLVRTARGRGQAHGAVKANGTYRVALPRGHNRTVQVVVAVPSLNAYVCSAKIAVRVRAGVRLSASRAVRPGGTVHFTGRLLGGPLPRHGKVVELQAFDRGQWRTFASARARGKHRRFRASYHLTQTFGPRTFRFRARVRREADYPYVLGYSRSVSVRVV